MKKWYVCKYGLSHVQNPHECEPIGIAYQSQMGDPSDAGFICISDFENYLKRNDLCAFGEGYEDILSKRCNLSSLRVIHVGRKR